MSFLLVENLTVCYGGIHALHGISLRVEQGEVVALIGGNGAGKTTTLRAISGILRPRQAASSSTAESIVGWQPHRIVCRDWCRCPKAAASLPTSPSTKTSHRRAFARHDRDGIRRDHERALDLLPAARASGSSNGRHAFRRRAANAGDRPGALGRPRLLMLDEPSLGLAPQVVQTVFQVIREIAQAGTTILLVEQNAGMALKPPTGPT